MAHIVSCMVDADTDDSSTSNTYIARAISPQTSNESLDKAPSSSTDKFFVWRMHQPERKYQLFPKDKQPAAAPGKSLDPEQAFALAMGQNGDKADKASGGSGLRIRIKEHNLIRRRKVSVPELGPMTTVQEVAMDSPTIPGRPPLHERSISAPGHSWKQHHLVEYMALPMDHSLDEKPELRFTDTAASGSPKPPQHVRQPLSPKNLTPLVIPTHNSPAPQLSRQLSLTRIRSGSMPIEPSIRSARTDDASPKPKTPFTPLSAALATPKSAATSTMTASTMPTPISAPIESRSSPRPWEKSTNYALVTTPKDKASEASSTPKADPFDVPRSASAIGHRRNQSESASIMERGRPRKRGDTIENILKRSASKRTNSAERRAFEHLPKGWKASDAANMLSQSEMTSLQKQALQQACRFEILRKDDVDNLSRELRQLDERTEYLRRTYTSLRAGRRNLHTRICQYLRSPRTAKFSHDSMLKQEEALAELDTSIDDWVTKLEQAENRRTRVRQKLLEHVAAAATLPSPGGVVGVSESLQLAMGIRPQSAISTPPRSPTKMTSSHTISSSPSPQRVVAQVPSTILEQPLSEEEAAGLGLSLKGQPPSPGTANEKAAAIRRAETIRIYADNDVYALLADVENQITSMGASAADVTPPTKEAKLSEAERRQLHRAHSEEMLNGAAKAKMLADARAAQTPSPSMTRHDEVLLTNAVFRPDRSVLAM